MENQPLVQPDSTPDPFRILYNFRTRGRQPPKPRRKTSACERHHSIPQFTMRTRKMTAQSELKLELFQQNENNNQQQIVEDNAQTFMKIGQAQHFFLNNEECLQNGIPLTPEAEKEILFNFSENSPTLGYSKLERALSGFNFSKDKMDEE